MSQTHSPISHPAAPEIWVALDDPAARLRLGQAAAALGFQTRVVAPAAESAPPACAAIVTDLEPPEASLVWLERQRVARQGIPIVLYLPVRTGVDDALTRAMAIGVDALVFQRGKADERDRLLIILQGVLDQRLVANLLDRLAATVPRSSVGFRILKHYGIKMAGGVDAADHVDTVARALGSSPRTLQRLLRADAWPAPKELLDWMMLFLIALDGQLPPDRTVRRRLRRAADRLLGSAMDDVPMPLNGVVAAFDVRLRELAR